MSLNCGIRVAGWPGGYKVSQGFAAYGPTSTDLQPLEDTHSVLISTDDSMKLTLPGRDNVQGLYDPADFDFRLKPGSKAIGAGVVLPTINNNVAGKAPGL